jgi:ribulose-phosphate 3-epimerase
VHVEACTHLHRVVQQIRQRGKRVGVTLNPATSEETLRHIVGDVDLILVMSVNPGFGGQSFIEGVLPKVRAIRQMIDELSSSRDVDLEIDGGIGHDTAGRAAAAGARVFVAGNAIFTRPDYATAIADIRREGEKALER